MAADCRIYQGHRRHLPERRRVQEEATMTLDRLLADLCVHCSDPLDDQGPEAGGITLSRLEPGLAHFLCEWQALQAAEAAA